MDSAAFLTYLRHCPMPTLGPGDTVVMDNLPAHKVTSVRDILDKAGAQLCYMPPYSLDLNPIENTFTKLKTLIRNAGERITKGLQQQIGRAINAFCETQCPNYFRHQGYRKPAHERLQSAS
ncbi:MAG: transposase [Pseudomonadota bacterium]